ncbi:ribosome maturation factor RimP [Desulfonatronum parangueonense]
MQISSDSRRQPNQIVHHLESLILPVVHGLGLELWGTEYLASGRKGLIRLYIDCEGGVTIDQCAQVSRQLGPALEMDETLPGTFTLEVSSPGLERKFFQPAQLEAYIGRTVHALLHEPKDGCKSFRGELVSVNDAVVTLTHNAERIALAWDQIKKINLVHIF